MAQIRRQEFVVSLADIAANPTKVLAANEFLYVRQADGKLKMMCGDGATAISALPYSIDIGAIEQAKIDAKDYADTAAQSNTAAEQSATLAGQQADAALESKQAAAASAAAAQAAASDAVEDVTTTLEGLVTEAESARDSALSYKTSAAASANTTTADRSAAAASAAAALASAQAASAAVDLQIIDDTTGTHYQFGADNGLIYLEEVTS